MLLPTSAGLPSRLTMPYTNILRFVGLTDTSLKEISYIPGDIAIAPIGGGSDGYDKSQASYVLTQ